MSVPRPNNSQPTPRDARRERLCRYGYLPYLLDCPTAHKALAAVTPAVLEYCEIDPRAFASALPNTNLDAYQALFQRKYLSSGVLRHQLTRLLAWSVADYASGVSDECEMNSLPPREGQTGAAGDQQERLQKRIRQIKQESEEVALAAIEALAFRHQALACLMMRGRVALAYREQIESRPPPCCKSVPMDQFLVAALLSAVTMWDRARSLANSSPDGLPPEFPAAAQKLGEQFWRKLLSQAAT